MRIRRLNHSVYQTEYHIVWGTKYRRKLLKQYVKSELIKSLYLIQRKHPAWFFHEINTDHDHVHILLELPPTDNITASIQEIKATTSSYLKKKFKFISQIYSDGGMWSVGYFVSTVGLNESLIAKYIQKQGEWESGEDITTEFS